MDISGRLPQRLPSFSPTVRPYMASHPLFGPSPTVNVTPTWSRETSATFARPLVRTSNGTWCGTSHFGSVYGISPQGKELWRAASGPRPGPAGPVVAGPPGTLVAFGNDGGAVVLDDITGNTLRSFSVGTKFCDNAVVTAAGKVGCKSGDRHVALFDPLSGRGWNHSLSDTIAQGPVCDDDGHLYVFTHGLNVVCLDAADGHERWTHPMRTHVSSLAAHGDTLYAAASYGRIFALDRTRGDEQWNVMPPVTSNALSYRDPHLSVGDNGTLYAGASNGHIFALSPTTRQLIWNQKAGVEDLAAPVVAGERLLFGGKGGRVQAVSSGSGKTQWSFESGGAFVSRPLVDGPKVAVADDKGRVYALEPGVAEERQQTQSLEEAQAAAERPAPSIERAQDSVVIGGIRVPRRPAARNPQQV